MNGFEKIQQIKNKYVNQIKYIYKHYIKDYNYELTEEEMKKLGLIFVGIKKDKFMYLSIDCDNYIDMISEKIDKGNVLNKIKNSIYSNTRFSMLYLFCCIKSFQLDVFSTGIIQGCSTNDFVVKFLIEKEKIIITHREVFYNKNKDISKLSEFLYVKNLFSFIEKEIYFAMDYDKNKYLLDKNFNKLDFNKYNYLRDFPEKKARLTNLKGFVNYFKDEDFYVVPVDEELREIAEPIKIESALSLRAFKAYINDSLKEGFLVNDFFYYDNFKNKIKINHFEIKKGYNLLGGTTKSILIYSDIETKKKFTNQNYYLSFSEIIIDNIKYRIIFYKYRLYLVEINNKLFGYGIKYKQLIKNIKNRTNELLETNNKLALFINL